MTAQWTMKIERALHVTNRWQLTQFKKDTAHALSAAVVFV